MSKFFHRVKGWQKNQQRSFENEWPLVDLLIFTSRKLQKMEFTKFLKHNTSNNSCLKIRKNGPKSGSSKKARSVLSPVFSGKNDACIRLQHVVSTLKLDCNKVPAASLPKKNNPKIFRAFPGKIDVETMFRKALGRTTEASELVRRSAYGI